MTGNCRLIGEDGYEVRIAWRAEVVLPQRLKLGALMYLAAQQLHVAVDGLRQNGELRFLLGTKRDRADPRWGGCLRGRGWREGPSSGFEALAQRGASGYHAAPSRLDPLDKVFQNLG